MKWLTFLSIVYPMIAGAGLLIWSPEDRKIRYDYVMRVVLITSAVVLATVLSSWFDGSDATALHVLRMSEKLVLAFRLDGASMFFGLIIGILWPVTTLYAFSYMEHEDHQNKFFSFFIMTYGTVAGIAFSANMLTMYLCYELMTLATLPLVMHEMDGKARSAGQKYILYSMTGAAMIFVALIFLLEYGVSLDFVFGGILDHSRIHGHEQDLLIVFVLGFFGFGVKAAIFPFHGWLPSASVAPTPVTALLHAVAVVKSGAFAVMRLIYFLFGTSFLFGTWAQYLVLVASAITIVFGSKDLRSKAVNALAGMIESLAGVLSHTWEGIKDGFNSLVDDLLAAWKRSPLYTMFMSIIEGVNAAKEALGIGGDEEQKTAGGLGVTGAIAAAAAKTLDLGGLWGSAKDFLGAKFSAVPNVNQQTSAMTTSVGKQHNGDVNIDNSQNITVNGNVGDPAELADTMNKHRTTADRRYFYRSQRRACRFGSTL